MLSFITDNLFELFTLTISVIGGFLALFQWKQSVTNRRAEYIDTLLDKMQDDTAISDFIFCVDYGHEWYNADFHDVDNHKIAKQADRTLFFFNYLAYLLNMRLITKREFKIFDYHISTIAQDIQTKAYLLDLYQYSKKHNRTFPFSFYLDYCIENKHMSAECKSDDFFRYLAVYRDSSADNSSIPPAFIEIFESYGKLMILNEE